jgi:hypothetical protein
MEHLWSRAGASSGNRWHPSASKHAEAYLLIDSYRIAYGCESIGEQLRYACPSPGACDLQAVRAVVEPAPDNEGSLDCPLVQTRGDGLGDALIDCTNRLEPLVHIERSQLVAVGSDQGLRTDRLRIDEQAAGDKRGMDVAQGVHDALDRHASQRPAAERDVEALACDVERLRVVDGEPDPLALLPRQCAACRRHAFGVGIERVDPRGTLGGEGRQPTFAAADVEHARTVEADELGDRGRLDPDFVASFH